MKVELSKREILGNHWGLDSQQVRLGRMPIVDSLIHRLKELIKK